LVWVQKIFMNIIHKYNGLMTTHVNSESNIISWN
jgi:hypothetical protein